MTLESAWLLVAISTLAAAAGFRFGFLSGEDRGFTKGQMQLCQGEGKVLHKGRCWRQTSQGLVRTEVSLE